MDEKRPDPGQLLRKLQYEEEEKQKKAKGKLKIFLGYAAGSGKTYAMLEAAHEAKKHQVDVVAGYIEPHARPDTQAMIEGLEVIPPLMVDYKGIQLREFNLDAALQRKPQLLLVDELAHTNVHGSRNEKRYQDVQELLRAGINVYTTVNIQHLESLNDLVGNITNIEVRERIPDSAIQRQGDSYSSQTFLCFSCAVYGTLCGNTFHAGGGREDETNIKKPSGTGKGAGSKNRNGVW